jgi:hypothetical protein
MLGHVLPALANALSAVENYARFAINDMYCQPINEITNQNVEYWDTVPCPYVMGNMRTDAWSDLTTEINLIGA